MRSLAGGWRWGNFPVPGAHVVAIALSVILAALWPLGFDSGNWGVAAGVTFIAVAAGLMIWATAAAGPVDLSSPNQIVEDGPYRVSRHPMYVAWTIGYLGLTALLSSVWLLILLPPLAVWIHYESVREETRLLAAFGPAYEDYRARIPRYFPVRGRRSRGR